MALVLSIAGIGTLASCTKEKVTEKTIIQERQAEPSIRESIVADQESKSIRLKRSALGKAFLLIPTYRSSGRTPQWGDFKPLVVSFEKSGSKIGLYKLTNDNLYNTIAADKLLQSFTMIREDAESIQLDLSEGFKSMDIGSTLEIVMGETFAKQLGLKNAGIESAIHVKDAIVREVKEENNSIRIEQVTRLLNEKHEPAASDEDEDESSVGAVTKQENTMTFFFEIRPYVSNPNFAKTKLMDVDQRVGYFINFSFNPGSTLPDPQITRWDFSESRPPVTVALVKDVPEEVIPAIREGIEYWNRAMGREILKFQTGLDPKSGPLDRTVIVRWVPWDSAGFAYAGIQADPMTGEIFRGQIFMTSSWYLHGRNSFRLPEEFGLKKALMKELNLPGRICVSQQADLKVSEDFLKVSPATLQKASLEIVRQVIAHEMGHVMGLRHNFAGSHVFPGTDQELLAKKQTYLKDLEAGKTGKDITYPLTTTVMDYFPALETAMSGTYIKDQVLTYDADAVAWAYEGKAINNKKYEYCSDEHIMMANAISRSVYGCDRFDGFKNPLLGSLYEIRHSLMNLPLKAFAARLAVMNSTNPYRVVRTLKEGDISFRQNLSDLESIFYATTFKSPMVSIQTIIDRMIQGLAILPQNAPLFIFGEDSKFGEELQATSKELGGFSEIIKWLLPPTEVKEKFAQNQVEQYFEIVSKDQTLKMAPEELSQMKEIFMKEAVKFDRDHEIHVLTTLLPFSVQYEAVTKLKDIDPEVPTKKKMRYFSTKLDLGNIKEIFGRYRKAAIVRDNEVAVVAFGKNLKLKPLVDYSNNDRRNLLKIFVSENWGPLVQYAVTPTLNSEKELLKQELVANGLALLQAAGIEVKSVTAAAMKEAYGKIDWNQVKGATPIDGLLTNEISQLEFLETLKKEE